MTGSFILETVEQVSGQNAAATVALTETTTVAALRARLASATVAETVARTATATIVRYAASTSAVVVTVTAAGRRNRRATATVAEIVTVTALLPLDHLVAILEPAAADWQIVVCDLDGDALINITQIARARSVKYQHNRPTAVSFQLASGDDRVAAIQADGDPYIAVGTRTVKLFRNEAGTYVCRANCTIETVEDSGDPENATTSVTAYSPFYDLGRRFCRNAGGNYDNVPFAAVDGSQIVKTLIDRTNSSAGNCGIETTGATYEDVDDFTVTYAYQMVAPAILDLVDAFNGFDFYEEALDQTDGKQVKLHCVARRGTDREDTIFGWGMWPHNIATIRNFVDRSNLTNYLVGLGSGSGIDLQHTSPYTDAASITKYRRLEATDSMPDVGNFFIGPLTQEELGFRKVPRQVVTWTPQPGIAFGLEPFLAFDVGDTVQVYAGARLRGGFTGIQRVYGFTLELDDEGAEQVSEMVTSPA